MFSHVVDVNVLSICIILRSFVVVLFMCLLYVSLGSRPILRMRVVVCVHICISCRYDCILLCLCRCVVMLR